MCNWRDFFCLLLFLSPAVQAHEIDQLTVIRGAGPKQLQIRGEPGREYVIQGASDLTPANDWQVLQQFTLPQAVFEWVDPVSANMPRRFYRLIKMPLSDQPFTATNFRLLDQQGKTRELQYYSNQQAIVLIFADSNCTGVEQSVPTLKALRDQYSNQSVLFWLIIPDAQSTRAEVADRASRLGIDWPILQDAAQLVTRDLNAYHSLEAICLNAANRTVFYRGTIDNRGDPNSTPSQNYLSDALATFLAGKTVSPLQKEFNGCDLSLMPTQRISYANDIAPILQKNCVSCHSAGNIAPWEMKSYDVVKNFAPLIKEKVMTGEMPPWHADPAYGTFANDISLKPQEASALVQWIDSGSPRGDGPDPLADLFASQPPPPDYPNTWPAELGEPDHVVSLPKYNVSATGPIDYEYISVSVDIPNDVWLRAAVILPGNTKVVHHSLVFMGTKFEVLLSGLGLGGYFAGYVPGMKPVEFPTGTAKHLPANATVTFQMHYTAIGSEETDETRLGLYFAKQPHKSELVTTAAANVILRIPPGASEYEREASVVPSTKKDIFLYELSPHMHYRGSRFKFEAVYPNGTSEVLLSVPNYDFHWQTLYRLAQPKRLPVGTRIRCLGAFDNSSQNPDNPNPAATVKFGEQTDDEMFIGYLNFSEVPD